MNTDQSAAEAAEQIARLETRYPASFKIEARAIIKSAIEEAMAFLELEVLRLQQRIATAGAAHASEQPKYYVRAKPGRGQLTHVVLADPKPHASEQGADVSEALNRLERALTTGQHFNPRANDVSILVTAFRELSQRPTPATASEAYTSEWPPSKIHIPSSDPFHERLNEIVDQREGKPDSATAGKDSVGEDGRLPCPFCGSAESREVDLSWDDPWFAIQCWRDDKVGCGTIVGSSLSFKDAEIKWNNRAATPSGDSASVGKRVTIESGHDPRLFSGTYALPIKILVNDDVIYETR